MTLFLNIDSMDYRIIYANICINSLFAIVHINRYVDHVFDLRHHRCDSIDSIT
jgi:hypothetical protein